MFRQSFSTPASWLAHELLGLPRHGAVPRYLKLVTTFLLSGLLHFYIDSACSMSVSESGAVRFFITQAFGIMIEDGIQEIWTGFKRHSQYLKGHQAGVQQWEKMIGFAWTVAFLAWSTPVWSYPSIRRQTGEAKDAVLPFSMLQTAFGKPRAGRPAA